MTLNNIVSNIQGAQFEGQLTLNSGTKFSSEIKGDIVSEVSIMLIIAKDSTVKGNITITNGQVTVQGHVNGDVHAKTVVLESSGVIDGNVIADTIKLEGKINGKVTTNSKPDKKLPTAT